MMKKESIKTNSAVQDENTNLNQQTKDELGKDARENIRKVADAEERIRNFQVFTLNLIIIITIIWLLLFKAFGFIHMPNNDMNPRIDGGDLLMYYRLNKAPSENEIIVLDKNSTLYIGRVIAKPGDEVNITDDDTLSVNGNVLNEPNISGGTPKYEGFVSYPLTLGEDEYFILVDNRDGGEDSRYYGPVKKSEIKGIVITLIRRNNL